MSFTELEKENLLLKVLRQELRVDALHDSNIMLLDRVQELEYQVACLKENANIPPIGETNPF